MTRVVCVGDVMVDVLALLPHHLAAGSDTPSPVALLSGGSAANTAAWLAATGVDTTFVGRVGDDALGRKVVDELAAAGVTLAVSTDAKLATGICIVLVDPDGERTMVPCAGANAVGGSMPPLDPGSHVHLSGYALFYGSFGVAEIICDARARQCTLSVDAASAAPLRAFGPDAFLDVISPALLLANEDEAAALTGMTDPEPAARALGHRSGEVIVKCGSRGGIWSDGTQVVRAATAPVVPVDSTGAGDAFAAGVLAARLSGASVADTLAAGNQLASRVISRRGGRP